MYEGPERRSVSIPALVASVDRLRRLVLLAILGAAVVLIAQGIVDVAYVDDHSRDASYAKTLATRIQGERVHNSQQSCAKANAQNYAIVRFVIELAPQISMQVRRAFPHTDCPIYVKKETSVS